MLSIHSGSRGLGREICTGYLREMGREAPIPELSAGQLQTAAAQQEQLLGIVQQLAAELRTQGRRPSVHLDSSLERDLGFDSLARAELLRRTEQAFGLILADDALTQVETPRELLRLCEGARHGRRPCAGGQSRVEASQFRVAQAPSPVGAATLVEALCWHARNHPARTQLRLLEAEQETAQITYSELLDEARCVAHALQLRDVGRGATVALMLPTSRAYFVSFVGVLVAGAIPVPLYPPARRSQLEDHIRRHAGIMNNARASLLVTVPEAVTLAKLLKAMTPSLRHVVPFEQLASQPDPTRQQHSTQALTDPLGAGPEELALLQYTSGSTGQPKGVALTHQNLLANIRAMGEAAEVTSEDVFVSWLPLYHDMGLIGMWLTPLYFGCPLTVMSPLSFLRRPSAWLWAMHRDRGTISAAPNFAFELCVHKVDDQELEGLDLSAWRWVSNGAEPISAQTLEHFCERFEKYGFARSSMAPVYGLAECAVGVTFPSPGREPRIDRVKRETLLRQGQAKTTDLDDTDALQYVGCGQPLPGHQVRVVDPLGRELPERRVGRLEFRGPSATGGYYRNRHANRRLFRGSWLDSGDLAYIAEGELYITGRAKDVIIRAGRNIVPYEIEDRVGDVAGIRRGCVSVFGVRNPARGTEDIVVVAETRETGEEEVQRLGAEIVKTVAEALGEPPDDVLLVPPRSVLKTSSGKLRRAATRELYLRGRLSKQQRGDLWQYLRLGAAAARPTLARALHASSQLGYGAYMLACFGVVAAPAWGLVATLPNLRTRWRILRRAAEGLARSGAIALHVEGLEHLDWSQPHVFVANHASYLDPLVLAWALPEPVAFVAKAELAEHFVSRVPLVQLGVRFVERFERQQAVQDAERLARDMRDGRRSLFFFPEGTLTRAPGLMPFHLGAFLTAATAGVDVVPVVIRGTRSVLRDGAWLPRRGSIRIKIGRPIMPAGNDWKEALRLRNRARSEMLQELGEPARQT